MKRIGSLLLAMALFVALAPLALADAALPEAQGAEKYQLEEAIENSRRQLENPESNRFAVTDETAYRRWMANAYMDVLRPEAIPPTRRLWHAVRLHADRSICFWNMPISCTRRPSALCGTTTPPRTW
jgi:hypothetical protein